MFFADLVFALAIALLLTAVFSVGFRQRQPWHNIWIFFFVIFLATWAGGVWMIPLAAPPWGANGLAFLFGGLMAALLLTALVPAGRSPLSLEAASQQADTEATIAIVWGLSVWLLILILVAAIAVGYVYAL